MKKLLVLVLGATLFSATGDAQALKQAGGENNLELQFAPLGSSPISMGGIRYRKFMGSGSSALRINFLVSMSSDKEITQQADTSLPELATTNSTFNFSIAPGFEKHMTGTDNLSPYVGAEIAVAFASSKEEVEMNTGTNDVGTMTTKDGSISFGINLLAGADYYFSKSIYIGAEMGFGFALTSLNDKEVTFEGFDPDIDNPDPVSQGSAWMLGPNYQGTLRLGWLF